MDFSKILKEVRNYRNTNSIFCFLAFSILIILSLLCIFSKNNILLFFIVLILFLCVILSFYFFKKFMQLEEKINLYIKDNSEEIENLNYERENIQKKLESEIDVKITKCHNIEEKVSHIKNSKIEIVNQIEQRNQSIFSLKDEFEQNNLGKINLLKDIKGQNKSFVDGINGIKILVSNISKNVDGEVHFSRNIVERIKGLFDIIKNSIKVSEILQKNSEFLVVIMQTIEEISNKIHILSLNASITAARSGEAGKPFMIVAKEIRRLSQDVKTSVSEMKNYSSLLTKSIISVNDNINKINVETQTTHEDISNLLNRFEGLYLSLSIIDRKTQANILNIENTINLLDSKTKEYEGSNQNINNIITNINFNDVFQLLNEIEDEINQILQKDMI
ncbi:MAG: hypothetical protein A2086_13650 [Spirochaetes bacterium GWD1_27_9]|nr:MAG: hypothetical protein A2Z98_02505 [Spirochaetes bacterium GWB1_27_13]OHD30703.1 MAG: hypothetical protein A2086_13650 [Spirochaetes bacterium GWD1_27_9]